MVTVKLSVRGKLFALVGLFALGCTLLAGILIGSERAHLYAARDRELVALVDSVTGVFERYNRAVVAGQLSAEQARAAAYQDVAAMRYGEGDYFFAVDREGVQVMHGVDASVVGRNRLGERDASGRAYFQEMKEVVDRQGAGFVTYSYKRPGTDKVLDKRVYIKLFAPWNVAVATGVYLEDIDHEVMGRVAIGGSVTLAIIVLLGSIAFLLARGISRPLATLRQAMLDLAEGHASAAQIDVQRSDEIGEMARAVLVFRENAEKRAQLEAQAEADRAARAERQGRVEGAIGEFRGDMAKVLDSFGLNVSGLESTAKTLSAVSEGASEQAVSAASAAEEAAGNVGSVASAVEELGSSVQEIARQVVQANEVITRAANLAVKSNDQVGALAASAQKIGQVVELINSIASQTNLLALNATIEAARAGDAGRGFAVVASEVKTLASQTARATEEIAAQVAGIQQATTDAVQAIGSISGTMGEVQRFTASISAAIEQQGAATQEISRNIAEASAGTEMVARNVAGVTSAIGEAHRSSGQVLTSGGELANAASNLQTSVETFLHKVAA